jgi:hypothetical protein
MVPSAKRSVEENMLSFRTAAKTTYEEVLDKVLVNPQRRVSKIIVNVRIEWEPLLDEQHNPQGQQLIEGSIPMICS